MKILIDDPDDVRINVFQGLRDHVLRQRRERPGGDMAGIFICEGDIPVGRALFAGYELQSVLVDAKRKKPMPGEISDDVVVYQATPEVLQRITGYNLHRGCIACFKRKDLLTDDEVLDQVEPQETLLIAEGINNPTNMGVILRCAAGLGVGGLLMDSSCSDPLYRRSVRVSMGEAFLLPYARLESWPQDLQKIKDADYEIWALTPSEKSESLQSIKKTSGKKIALMIGTEATGLTDQALEISDRHVKIAMSGRVDSINVGAASAIAFYAAQSLSGQI